MKLDYWFALGWFCVCFIIAGIVAWNATTMAQTRANPSQSTAKEIKEEIIRKSMDKRRQSENLTAKHEGKEGRQLDPTLERLDKIIVELQGVNRRLDALTGKKQ